MRSKSQILSKLRSDGHITDEEYKALEQEPCEDAISRQALLDDFGFSEKTRKWGGDHSGYNTMMLYEIQDMIESAPSVNPQDSGDLISRQAVMDCFKKWQPYMATRLWDFEKELSVLPSVKPQEPKKVLYSGDGYADGEMVYDMAECMNCGREFEYGDETWGCKFCPDCGQALKWEGEEE